METNQINEIALGLNEVPWLQRELWGNHLWQYGVFFVYVVAAVFLSKLADVLMSKYLKRLAQRTQTTLDDKLIELFHRPVKWVVFIILLHIGMKPMSKPDWMQDYLARAFGILVAVAITYIIIKLVDFGFEVAKDRLQSRDPRSYQPILVLLRKAAKIFVIISAVLVTADNIGIKIGGVLASFGLTGLAVALAAQETLSNLLGSIVILADRPYVTGDRIKIGADEGVVEHIGIRSTRLRTPGGDEITIPNRTVAASNVRNYSKSTNQLTLPEKL